MAGENLTPGIERVKYDPTKILGAPGLKAWAGRISEEWDPALQGSKAAKLYREMLDSEPVLATVVRMITTVLQQADVYVQPHKSGTPLAHEAKELVEECIEDMTPTWEGLLEDMLSAIAYGWSYCEITYKRRGDGRFGWASIDIRGQDTLDRWEIDDAGRVVGMWQMPPPSFKRIFIPIEKALHFRIGGPKGNPEGKSLFRACKRAYLFKRGLEEIEAIGVERELAGLPVLEVPPDLLGVDATAEERAFVDSLFKRVQNIRRDAEEAMILPASEWTRADGTVEKTGWRFSLVTSGGSRAIGIDPVIRRYEHRMLMTFLAEFLLLGEAGGGSYALAKDKSDFLVLSLTSILKSIVRVFTAQAIVPLMRLNGYPQDAWPTLQHDDIESPALAELSTYVSTLIQAGAIVPDEALERKLREWAALPQLGEDDAQHGVVEPTRPEADEEPEAREIARPPAEGSHAGPQREAEDLQSTAVNGAQVQAAKEIVLDVVAGRLPIEAARGMLKEFFQLSDQAVDRILGATEGFVPAAPIEGDDGASAPA